MRCVTSALPPQRVQFSFSSRGSYETYTNHWHCQRGRWCARAAIRSRAPLFVLRLTNIACESSVFSTAWDGLMWPVGGFAKCSTRKLLSPCLATCSAAVSRRLSTASSADALALPQPTWLPDRDLGAWFA